MTKKDRDKKFHEEIKKRNIWIDFDLVDGIDGKLPKINENEVVLLHHKGHYPVTQKDLSGLKRNGVSKSDKYDWWSRYMIIEKPMGYDDCS